MREQFVLLDEQQIAFDIVLHEVEKARGGDHKSVVIVSGGPGSGKSVIALSLLGELGRRGRTVVHATGSRSFTHTLRKVAGDRAPRVRSLFKYFNSFIAAERNGLDVLIADEAHRIRDPSADRWTKASLRTGKAQVDELIDAARVRVFLLDEHQIVRPGELGNVNDIEKAARRRAASTYTPSISTPSSGVAAAMPTSNGWSDCSGSGWVAQHGGMGIRASPCRWPTRRPPSRLRWRRSSPSVAVPGWPRATAGPGAIHERTGRSCPTCRSETGRDRGTSKAIARPAAPRRRPCGPVIPPGSVRSAASTQRKAFEYDWNGVIMGPDLVWRDSGWVSVRSANKDPDFRNAYVSR